MTVLVTGATGSNGFHLSLALIRSGIKVAGVDNHNSYYDPGLKESSLEEMSREPSLDLFDLHRIDLAGGQALKSVFDGGQLSYVVNLAAQAGVRHSLEQPDDYAQSNLLVFLNVL